MLLFLAKQSLLHHSLRGDWWTYEGFGEHMKVFFFTFVFECYQESVMVQPFTFRNNYQLGHMFFKCFFHKRFKKHRGFELLYRSSSCRFSAEWDAGEVFLLLFFNANKCFNLIDNSFLVFRLSTLKIVIHAGIRGLLITDVYSLLLLVSLIFLTKWTTAERNSCCNL